mmetsp:Transcript_2319/g.3170  ORF Transcript_2319/g.3170 Transcript_2319/m.3170 type:complete len:118 (-) Transcript_2319:246-599(-)
MSSHDDESLKSKKRQKPGSRHKISITRLLIKSSPLITDPRELETILGFSLRNLFGELETYSHDFKVTETSNNSEMLQITCPAKSARFLQAALTLATLPPYMENTLYRIDIVQKIEDV